MILALAARPCQGLGALVTLAAALALPASAHVLSVSQGSLRLDGDVVRYELRMPLSEVPDGPDRERDLLEAFRVRSGGEEGARGAAACREERGQQVYVCEASFEFSQAPASVEVRCEFPYVTVPHHVHVLRSGEGEVARQTVFDITSVEAEVRFAPPTWRETVTTEFGAGLRKAVTSPELLLFMIALAFAGRTRRELAGCVGAFLLAQAAAALAGSALGWRPAAGFLEAAAALTVAYVAAEILFLPEAGRRWLVCAAMGCFHGLFLAAFLETARMSPSYFLPGALGAESVLALGAGAFRLSTVGRRAERLGALLLLVTGLGWFALRMIG